MNKKIKKYMGKYNTEDILSAITQLQIMPEKKYLNMLFPVSEYIVANIIPYNNANSNKKLRNRNVRKLVELSKSEVFSQSALQTLMSAIRKRNASDDEKEDFLKSEMMVLKRKIYRGDGYLKQLLEFSTLLYGPLNQEFKTQLGFTYKCCEATMVYIFNKYKSKAIKCLPINEGKIDYKKLLQMKVYPISICNEYCFRVDKEELYEQFSKEDIENLLKFLSVHLGKVDRCFELSEFNIIYEKPFINFEKYIYFPVPLTSLMNLHKLFHYTFCGGNIFTKQQKELYKKNRGNIVEKLATQYLARLFGIKKIFNSLKHDENGKTYEADVTAVSKQANVFAECKSKILTLQTLQGNLEKMETDIYEAIGYAYEQGIRTAKWIQNRGDFYQENNTSKIIRISNQKENYILCITVEQFGIVSSEIDKYISIDKEASLIPIVIDLFDLDIITRECTTLNQFLEYLKFRSDNINKITFFDELDAFEYFRYNGYSMLKEELIISDYTQQLDEKYELENMEWFSNYN